MTALARAGRSVAMLRPHPQILRIEWRSLKYRRGAPFALDEHIDAAARRREFRGNAGERQTSPDPMSVGAGRGHPDTAVPDEHGLAAARVRVARRHLGVNDLERTRRLLERCRLADKVGLAEVDEARHIRFGHAQFVGELRSPSLVAFFNAHGID